MGKHISLSIALLAVASVCVGERMMSSHCIGLAVRQMSEPQSNFGTCYRSQAASIFSGYPCDCRSWLLGLNVSAMEKGHLDALEEGYNFFCEPRCGQPIVNAFCRCGFELLGELLVGLCGSNAQGVRCSAREMLELFKGPLAVAEANCLPYSPDSSCSLSCKAALENSQVLAGCCVNAFNMTSTDLLSIDDYQLWASCGVETPGFCGQRRLLPSGNCRGASAYIYVQSSSLWMVLAIVIMIVLAMGLWTWLQITSDMSCRLTVRFKHVFVKLRTKFAHFLDAVRII